jgi:uncharacterized protein
MMRHAKLWPALGLVLGLVCLVRAEPVSQLKPTGYIDDFANVLSSETQTALTNVCQQIDQKAHAQIAVVTIKSLDGSDIESYAVDLYKKWGIGSKATDRGVLILLATDDRKYRLEVGYGLEPILPDGKVGGFGREAVPYLRSGDYNTAVSLLTERVADTVATDAGIQITGMSARPPTEYQERPQVNISLGKLIFWGIVLLVVLATPLRKVLFWWLLLGGGRRGGGSWGGGNGWGGGGFGGGGGGFGGFGGGSSGGGGASGSW